MTVCAAVVTRLLRGGYSNLYLNTDDERLPAIKTYLKLGYRPVILTVDMETRWQTVCEALAWPNHSELWRTL